MLSAIFKQILLFKKRQRLHEITLEDVFLSFYYEKELGQDLEKILDKIEALLRDPKAGQPGEIDELRAQAVEIQQIKHRIDTNHKVKRELEMYIETIRQS